MYMVKTSSFILFVSLFFLISKVGHSMTNEDLYKACNSFKNNSFNDSQATPEHLMCMAYLKGVKDTKRQLCIQSLGFNKDMNGFFMSTKHISLNSLIMSFLNWAEKNPQEWQENPAFSSYRWGSKVFPCEIK